MNGPSSAVTVIRPAQPGDGQGLAQVWSDTAAYYVALDPDRFQVPAADGLADWFEARWVRPLADHQFARVADVGGQVVGLVDAVLEEPLDSAPRQVLRELAWRRLLVNALVVRTDFWRRGIGRQLLGAAEAWGRERGARVAMSFSKTLTGSTA
jgi:GNAT superfamily N-acetyltransferase